MLSSGAVFAVAATAFALLAFAVSRRSGPLGPDERLLRDVVDWRSAGLTALGKALTTFGTDVVVYPLLVLGAFACWRRTGRPTAGVLAIAVLISGQLIRVAINRTLARPRPPSGLHLVRVSGYAFPSGHTTTATLAYGLLAVLLAMTFTRGRWAFVTGAVVLAIGVGLSRIYLSAHWATDVAGGWLLGMSWLALAALLTVARARKTSPGRATRAGVAAPPAHPPAAE